MKAFACPHCGSHNYSLVLTGCNLTNATLQETFVWDEEARDYGSAGTLVVESDEVTPDASQAFCAECEKDVSQAVAAYEDSLQSGAAGA
jgi:hypothetical protein